jgi:hypothetical protein
MSIWVISVSFSDNSKFISYYETIVPKCNKDVLELFAPYPYIPPYPAHIFRAMGKTALKMQRELCDSAFHA